MPDPAPSAERDGGRFPFDEGSEDDLRVLVEIALREDLGSGDVTTLACIDETRTARGNVVAREPGIVSGVRVVRAIVAAVDPKVSLEVLRDDGDRFAAGDVILRLAGRARSLLTMERVLLNFLQRLSGVATLTGRFVDAVAGTGVAIADTRKTTPGMRRLEKAAVRDGGGTNHRIGLFDAYMVKDNHIVAAGSLTTAVQRIRATGVLLPLIVEAASMDLVREAAELDVDQVLMDNMSPSEIALAVETLRGIERARGRRRCRVEVSGGVTLETVRAKALAGVDWISIGALTHSARALDLALDLELVNG